MRLKKEEWQARGAEKSFGAQLELALATEGYFVLEEFVDKDVVDVLYHDFERLLNEHVSKQAENRGKNRYNIPLPPRAPFIDSNIQTNPLIFNLMKRMLGDDLAVTLLAADTPLEGSEYQSAHPDGNSLFPGQAAAMPAFNLVMNIMLVDFTPENGPLEIWPNGTHFSDATAAASGSKLRDPEMVLGPAGSVVVRDARMWHRGTPNRTPNIRPMMTVAYSRSWYRFGEVSAGILPPRIARQEFERWAPDMQALFRFSNVEEDANASVVSRIMRETAAGLLTA